MKRTKKSILSRVFGYSEFRGGQEKIIDTLLSGRDVFCVMPTGAGKSICYQIPALLSSGVTLVISPLISLMQDQVEKLKRLGVKAACINSTLPFEEYKKIIEGMRKGNYKIVYVAPERLETEKFTFICSQTKISLLIVDEAHCVFQWGKDFRPSYLRIAKFLAAIEQRPPIGAFTATATDEIRAEVIRALGLVSPVCVTTGFDRPNLRFEVRSPKSKGRELYKIVSERKGKSGIVYCPTRAIVEDICKTLRRKGFSSTRYHAGLSKEERESNQNDFLFGRKSIMVATNAFGMGIDKADVGYVVHYAMPSSIENYYQEAGRAGRNGESADCIILYHPDDVELHQYFITKSYPNSDLSPETVKGHLERDLALLRKMQEYCETDTCLRAFILHYFGEECADRCENCSGCSEDTKTERKPFWKRIFGK